MSNFEEKKKVLLAQVYQILLKLIQENNIIDYYQDYVRKMRKGSEDDIDLAVNPYMIRKIKFKQFMRKNVGQNKGKWKVWLFIPIIIVIPYKYWFDPCAMMDTKSIFSINTNQTGFKRMQTNGLPSQLIENNQIHDYFYKLLPTFSK